MVANVASRLPHFCVYGKANEHDSKKEDILFESLNAGDIGILDRAYNCFETLYRQSQRGVIFVVREKEAMLHEVIESAAKDKLAKNIIADETIRLTGVKTKESYPATLRRVTAHVEINGNWHDLTFLTNNFEWAASERETPFIMYLRKKINTINKGIDTTVTAAICTGKLV